MQKTLQENIIFNSIVMALMMAMTTIAQAQTIHTLTDSDLTVDENGVITACSYDFQNTDIKIPDYVNGKMVTGIVSNLSGVFSDKDITSVEFPESLTFIGNWAFYKNELTSIVLPDGLTYVGEWSFSDNQLASIELPPSLISIDDYAFYKNKFTSIEFPSSLTSIGDWAFGKNELTSIVLPNRLTSIGEAAFYSNQLTSVSFSSGLSSLKTIRGGAFGYNLSLTEIILPTTHKEESFLYFLSIINGKEVKAIKNFSNSYVARFSSYRLTESDLTVDENGVIIACSYDFENTDIIIPDEVNGIMITGIGFSYNFFRSYGSFQSKGITSVVFPEGITFIGDASFYGNRLTSVNFPSSLTTIGSQAFSKNFLEHVQLPPNLTSIGAGVFQDNQLKTVKFSSNLISIGYRAFAYNQLRSLVFPSSLTSIDEDAFRDNLLTSVLFLTPSSCKIIKKNAFYRNSLEAIVLPTSHNKESFFYYYDSDGNEVTKIQDFTKEYVAKFSAYTLTASELTVDENGIITSCEYNFEISNIIIPNEVGGIKITGIGNGDWNEGIFQNKDITSVVLPDRITTIGNNAFSDNKLRSVSFPSSLISIGDSAFKGNYLTSVEFPSSLTSINQYAFNSNQLTSVLFQENLTTIGDGAFSSNQLTSVSFPSSLTSINLYAFHSNQLTSVSFQENLTSIGEAAFYGNALTSVIFPSSLASIDDYAFYNNNIKSVKFPSNLISIGEGAFHGNQLTSVLFQENLISIGDFAFFGNELMNVVFPSSLTSIGKWAFRYNKLINVSFSSEIINLRTVGEGAFSYNEELSSIDLPSDNSNEGFIGYKDFQGNKIQPTENGTYSISEFSQGYNILMKE